MNIRTINPESAADAVTLCGLLLNRRRDGVTTEDPAIVDEHGTVPTGHQPAGNGPRQRTRHRTHHRDDNVPGDGPEAG